MSRTRKGSKGVGYEVDRKREGKRGWRSHNAFTKRIGVRAQRRLGVDECKEIAAHCPHCAGEGCDRCLGSLRA